MPGSLLFGRRNQEGGFCTCDQLSSPDIARQTKQMATIEDHSPFDSRLEDTANLRGYPVDAQGDQTPAGVDLVPLHDRPSSQPQTVDRADRDAASARR